MTALRHYPPLAAVSRFLCTPPAAVSPELRELSDRATLAIGPEISRLFGRIFEDPRSLPLLAPTAIQLCAIACSLAGQSFLPFPSAHDSLQQLVGVIEHRVLGHGHRDPDFHERSPQDHLLAAAHQFNRVSDLLVAPAASPRDLHTIQVQLADSCAYLTFATYSEVPRINHAL